MSEMEYTSPGRSLTTRNPTTPKRNLPAFSRLVVAPSSEPELRSPLTPRNILNDTDKNRLVKQFYDLELPEQPQTRPETPRTNSEARFLSPEELPRREPGSPQPTPGTVAKSEIPDEWAQASVDQQISSIAHTSSRGYETQTSSIETNYVNFQHKCTMLSDQVQELHREISVALAALEAELPTQQERFRANLVKVEEIKGKLRALDEYDGKITALRLNVNSNFKEKIAAMNADLDGLEKSKQSYETRARLQMKRAKMGSGCLLCLLVAVYIGVWLLSPRVQGITEPKVKLPR
ncbi:hypothetical protein BABINDRAFT_9113 [Babjeviella inositovora NRRL Y-12698]|uniref:Uncharacterized protein n=1 Tax=Babjeviella inositovora NRRL Y-12698 TaxID=984486 RepID=A0A1E3QMF3_9ASCO|nr:uncharacterized protein BABINDRAFT_9113 [Babjeviella inositovora NRRL Y-12698]ODQ78886.1 hypothetical protein BABINDRAFT_9113 [Babjeviella inositovora NRRL Y-12698]